MKEGWLRKGWAERLAAADLDGLTAWIEAHVQRIPDGPQTWRVFRAHVIDGKSYADLMASEGLSWERLRLRLLTAEYILRTSGAQSFWVKRPEPPA